MAAAIVVAALLALAAPGSVERTAAADGVLSGNITWGGAPLLVPATISVDGATADVTGGAYSMPLPPGTYTPSYANLVEGHGLGNVTLALPEVTVGDGEAVTADFDLTSVAGFVTGAITLNGAAAGGLLVEARDAGGDVIAAANADAAGAFALFAAPGTYETDARDAATGALIGTISLDVTAAITTDAGTNDLAAGSVSGTVMWAGAPLTDAATVALGDAVVTVVDGAYSVPRIAPGTYAPAYAHGAGSIASTAPDVIVVAGGNAVADFDITALGGEVFGTVTVNGQPRADVHVYAEDGAGVFADVSQVVDGGFRLFVPPGDYTARVWMQNGTGEGWLGAIPITATAGVSSGAGVHDFATGTLAGAVTWNGAPLLEPGTVTAGGAASVVDGAYTLADVIPGSYAPLFTHPSGVTVQSAAVEVAGGATATADFDVTAAGGFAAGAVAINAAACATVTVVAETPGGAPVMSDVVERGQYRLFLPPGDYVARVLRSAPGPDGELASFPMTVIAGETAPYPVIVADSDCDGMLDAYETTYACLDAIIPDDAADPDGDALANGVESAGGTDPCVFDTDGDGCGDGVEVGPAHELGGQRNPLDPWDFYDVTGDRVVELGDALDILAYYGEDGTTPEQNFRDRDAPDLNAPWRTVPADDGLDLSDALVNLYSFGDACAPPPPVP